MECRPPYSILFPYTTLFRSCWARPGQLACRRSDALQLLDRALVADVAGVERRGGLEEEDRRLLVGVRPVLEDRKSTRLNSSHSQNSYAVFCLKKKNSSQNQK